MLPIAGRVDVDPTAVRLTTDRTGGARPRSGEDDAVVRSVRSSSSTSVQDREQLAHVPERQARLSATRQSILRRTGILAPRC